MIGLTILAVIALYLGAALLIVSAMKGRWTKAIAAFIAVAIPFWEFPFGYLEFRHRCSQSAGLHVLDKVPKSLVILIDTTAGYTPEEVLRAGIRQVEYQTGGKIVRHSPGAKGLTTAIDTKPLSLLKVSTEQNIPLRWGVIQNDQLLTRIDSGKVLARHSSFRWAGFWWQRAVSPFLGNGGFCYGTADEGVIALAARGTT